MVPRWPTLCFIGSTSILAQWQCRLEPCSLKLGETREGAPRWCNEDMDMPICQPKRNAAECARGGTPDRMKTTGIEA